MIKLLKILQEIEIKVPIEPKVGVSYEIQNQYGRWFPTRISAMSLRKHNDAEIYLDGYSGIENLGQWKEHNKQGRIRIKNPELNEIELDTNLTPIHLMKFLDKNKGEVFYELGIVGNKRGNPETFYYVNDLYFEVEETMVYLSGFPAGITVIDGVVFSTTFNENLENDFTIKNIKVYYTIF